VPKTGSPRGATTRPEEISQQLNHLASAQDFLERSAELTDAWSAAGVGVEAVERTLRFMEDHPEVDVGTPGPLVHFVEAFAGRGYEQRLVESIQRLPTPQTLWMLNRLINGTRAAEARRSYIELLLRARSNPRASAEVQAAAERYLSYQC
jgi:hypothetical protein